MGPYKSLVDSQTGIVLWHRTCLLLMHTLSCARDQGQFVPPWSAITASATCFIAYWLLWDDRLQRKFKSLLVAIYVSSLILPVVSDKLISSDSQGKEHQLAVLTSRPVWSLESRHRLTELCKTFWTLAENEITTIISFRSSVLFSTTNRLFQNWT